MSTSIPLHRRLARALLTSAIVALGSALSSHAQPSHGEPPHGQPPHRGAHPPPAAPRWHGDIRQFHQHDWPVWRGGHWAHGPHGGRVGWWWVVGSVWYFYPAPIYPYPNPYEPPPAWVVAPPGTAVPPPAPQFWYYCDAANGYYPYVPTCPGGWRQVPATPSDVTDPPAR